MNYFYFEDEMKRNNFVAYFYWAIIWWQAGEKRQHGNKIFTDFVFITILDIQSWTSNAITTMAPACQCFLNLTYVRYTSLKSIIWQGIVFVVADRIQEVRWKQG